MALIGNGNSLFKSTPSLFIGANIAFDINSYKNAFPKLSRFSNTQNGLDKTTSIPNGYNGYTIALSSGGMATYNDAEGLAQFLADNPGSSASITGSATFTSSIASILQAVASVTGTSTFSDATLGALVSIVANIVGTGSFTNADLKALASISASIQIGGTGYLSQVDIQNLANAVWDVLIANHLSPGSAGEFLNGAGGGSSPSAIASAVWDELLATHNLAGSAGKALSDAKTNTGLIPALL
jgi:hypothetical protein